MTDKIIVLITAKDAREATRIARHLLDKRLIACANLVPQIRSLYRWHGKLADEKECWMILKSTRKLFLEIQAEVEKVHSYDLPEVIAVPILEGSAKYLKWISSSVSSSKTGQQRP